MANQNLAVANLYEAYTIPNTKIFLDSGAHHVLCLGNSITLHTFGRTRPGASPFWEGRWGMCASRPDSDYVHRLGRMFMKVNVRSTIMGVNIADWETNPKRDKNSLFGKYMRGKDLIIIRLGENVSESAIYDSSIFEDAYMKLLSLFSYSIRLISIPFWPSKKKQYVMTQIAIKSNSYLVDLSHLGNGTDPENFAESQKKYKTPGVGVHPGNIGMKHIAECYYAIISVH